MLQNRVRSGELDRIITFVEKVISSNNFNEDAEASWQAVADSATVFARVVERSKLIGNEQVQADRVATVQITIFTVRYRADITTKAHRIVYQGRPYNIVNIIETPGSSRQTYLDMQSELVDNETWT